MKGIIGLLGFILVQEGEKGGAGKWTVLKGLFLSPFLCFVGLYEMIEFKNIF